MEKYSNLGHPTTHFAKLGQQPNNWAQLMPRLPPLNPQFKLSKIFLHPLLNLNTNTQNPGPAPANNDVEYEALLHGLRLAALLGIKRLLVYGDSAVVINQVSKS
jgi:hypothetical protein